MKKKILLLAGMLCAFLLASAQGTVIDNAVRGTGLNQHNYVGPSWIHGAVTNTFYKSTHSANIVANTYMTFTFEGTKIEWYTEKKFTHGIVAISIDGGAEIMIDLFSGTEQHLLVYTSPTLLQGTHVFKMRTTGTKNAASTNYYSIHDYFITYDHNPGLPPYNFETNTAFGEGTLSTINQFPPGGGNTAFGYQALKTCFLGAINTAVGAGALGSVSKGNSGNTAIGYGAMGSGVGGLNSGENTAVGALAMRGDAGSHNTALGYLSGPVAETFLFNTTALGHGTNTTASNQVRIGNANVTSIGGQVSWSTLSDGRFKRDLREDVSGLEFVNKLRPVSYTVDKNAVQAFMGVPDSVRNSRSEVKEIPIRQTGFVAQEVEAIAKKSGYVFSGVDVPKNDKDPYTIRYAEFVVPLVKAVQELSAQNNEQAKQIADLVEQLGKKDAGNTESSQIELLQNNPNPFTQNTEIKMILPESVTTAHVIVYNLEGKQLKEFKVKGRGDTSVILSGNELNAGMYIYALIADNKVVDTKRMILTK